MRTHAVTEMDTRIRVQVTFFPDIRLCVCIKHIYVQNAHNVNFGDTLLSQTTP